MNTKKFNRREFLRTSGLVGLSAASLLAGCKPGTPQSTQVVEPGGEVLPTSTQPPAPAGQPTIFRYLAQTDPPGPDEREVQQYIIGELNRIYNLNIDFAWEAAGEDIQTFDMKLQTQQIDGMQMAAFVTQKYVSKPGLLMELDDVINRINPTLHDNIAQEVWDYIGRNGKKVGIPGRRAAVNDTEYIYIRRDWLKKIDRDIPQTLEDFEECLRLFKEKELGAGATIPFTLEESSWVQYEQTLLGPFAPEYDEQIQMLQKGENIEFQFGLAFRPGRLEMLNRWFKDGLMNPEFAVWSGDQVWDAVGRGLVGSVSGGWWNQMTLRDIEKADPNQDWVQIYPPLGLKDKPNTGRIVSLLPVDRAIIIASWAKAPEALVALIDWVNTDPQNSIIASRGLEGKHWKRDETGQIIDLRSPSPNREYIGSMGSVATVVYWAQEMFDELKAPGMAIKQEEILRQAFKGPFTRKSATTPEPNEYPTINMLPNWCPILFPESGDSTSDLETLRNEYVIKIIKGETPVESGTVEFWDKWMKAGGEIRMKEILEQFNAWIAKYPKWNDPKAVVSPENWFTDYTYPEKSA